MFRQVTVGEDLNKKAMKENYQAAVARLEGIRDTAAGMSQAEALDALSDLAVIQLRTLKVLRELLA